MRICLIGPVYPFRGGIAHYTTQLVQVLGSAGHDVDTISFKRQYPNWLYPGVSDKDPSHNATRVEAVYLLDPMYPWTWAQACQRVTKWQPALVVIQWWTTFWAPAYAWMGAALRRRGHKVVYLIHNVYPHERRFFDRWLAWLALKQGWAFVVQTDREKSKLLKLLPERRVELCHLPGFSMLTGRRIPRLEARQRLGIDANQPLLLFFGIVRPYKGLKVLIEALGLMGEADQLPRLVVAGEIWEDKGIYQQLIKQFGLADRVQLEDRYVPDDEAAIMLSAADLLVAPYLDGTQSAAASMALGFGLPLVVSDVVAAGIAEENLRNVWIAPAGDAAALAEAIRQALGEKRGQPQPGNFEKDWQRLVLALEALVGPR